MLCRMKKSLSLFLLLLPAIAGVWPTYQGNAYHTGNNDNILPLDQHTTWIKELESEAMHIAPDESSLYVLSRTGFFYRLDKASGEVIYKIKLPHESIRHIVFNEDYVYLADRQWLICLYKRDGSTRWSRKDFEQGIYTAPVVDSQQLIYASRSQLFFKNADNGHDLREAIPIEIWGGFAYIDNSFIYMLSKPAGANIVKMLKVNRNTFKRSLAGQFPYDLKYHSPQYFNDEILVASGKKLLFFNNEGQLTEQKALKDYVVSQPALTPSGLYLRLRDSSLYLLPGKDEKLKPVLEAGTKINKTLYIAHGLFYGQSELRNYQGEQAWVSQILGIDAETGEQFFHYEFPGPGQLRSMVAAGGQIYAANGKAVYSIGEKKSIVQAPANEEQKKEVDSLALSLPDNLPTDVQVHLRSSNRNESLELPGQKEAFTIDIPDWVTEIEVQAVNDEAISPGIVLDEELFRLEKPSTVEIPMQKIAEEKSFDVESILFDSGKASLKNNSMAFLNNLQKYMAENPDYVIDIIGHTDNVGNEAFNLKLSEQRARSVKHYLVAQGIYTARIKTLGKGESQPVADNATEAGRKKNRRTELRLYKKP